MNEITFDEEPDVFEKVNGFKVPTFGFADVTFTTQEVVRVLMAMQQVKTNDASWLTSGWHSHDAMTKVCAVAGLSPEQTTALCRELM